jgi:peptidoglycan/LPS O-acetylase OafA/YrhL
MAETKKQLLPLTGMRFFLALWVVIFHQPFFHGYAWMSALPMPFPSLFNSGYLAVGVFFALSGFVLAYNYPLDKPWAVASLKRYGIARFSRIYPAYFLGLILSAPFVLAALAREFTPIRACAELVKAGLAGTLLQGWFPPAAEAWNKPGWSLSVEAFFYCCFPFLGVALWKLSRPRALLASGLVIWAASLIGPLIAAAIPLLDVHGVPGVLWTRESAGFWVNFTKFTPLLQVPQFCMGVVTARAYSLLQSRNSALLGRGYWLYLPGVTLEILTIAACQSKFYPFLHNGLLLPLHSMTILGFALGGGLLARGLSLRPLVFLGNASYSMYIFHAVIAEWISGIAKRLLSTNPVGMNATFLYVVAVIGLSSVIYKMFEEPAHRGLKRTLTSWFNTPHRKSERPVLVGVECAN